MAVIFDYKTFYKDLDTRRKRRGLSWHKVATRSGLTPSSVMLFANESARGTFNKGLSLESVLNLMSWMHETDITKYTMDEDELDNTE